MLRKLLTVALKVDQVVELFGENTNASDADLSEWNAVAKADLAREAEIKIAMVGKYIELSDAYKSLNEALNHAGLKHGVKVKIVYIEVPYKALISQNHNRDYKVPENKLNDLVRKLEMPSYKEAHEIEKNVY